MSISNNGENFFITKNKQSKATAALINTIFDEQTDYHEMEIQMAVDKINSLKRKLILITLLFVPRVVVNFFLGGLPAVKAVVRAQKEAFIIIRRPMKEHTKELYESKMFVWSSKR